MRRRGFVLLPLTSALSACRSSRTAIAVGSKNFSENVFLGELIAQQLEAAGLSVERRLNLGGTFLCHQALIADEIGIYPEYTGTALTAILRRRVERDRRAAFDAVAEGYKQLFGARWLRPFGFEDNFALLVRGDEPEHLRTISDLAAKAGAYTLGCNFEFLQREDGLRGLLETYGLRFAGEPRTLDLNLVYRALHERRIDVAVGNSTHGLIERYGLRLLEDDRRYFPPYEAAPVVRESVLETFPSVESALNELGDSISHDAMRGINHAIDVEGRRIETVAREHLAGLAERSGRIADGRMAGSWRHGSASSAAAAFTTWRRSRTAAR